VFNLEAKAWKVLSRKTLFDRRPWILAESHEIQLPNGDVIPDWVWLDTPDFVNVIAVTEDRKVLCFLQNKYAIEGMSYAPVGGYIDANETAIQAAQRELKEEAGYSSDHWVPMGNCAADGNRGCGNGHLFLALEANRTSATHADDLEEMHLLHLSLATFESHVLAGEFKLLPWSATAALALLHLKKLRPDWFRDA
jgi:ADP-ribose pyrophosphatase